MYQFSHTLRLVKCLPNLQPSAFQHFGGFIFIPVDSCRDKLIPEGQTDAFPPNHTHHKICVASEPLQSPDQAAELRPPRDATSLPADNMQQESVTITELL